MSWTYIIAVELNRSGWSCLSIGEAEADADDEVSRQTILGKAILGVTSSISVLKSSLWLTFGWKWRDHRSLRWVLRAETRLPRLRWALQQRVRRYLPVSLSVCRTSYESTQPKDGRLGIFEVVVVSLPLDSLLRSC